MRARLAVLALLALAGCYRPNAPGGSYLCGSADVCPDGLECICGQCVAEEAEAACSFEIGSTDSVRSLSVDEHQPFDVVVNAYAKSGAPATKFSGAVRLSSTWGDVCVGTNGCIGMPDKVTLSGGVATATVQLNRETIPPQTAILRAEFAGNVGSSGKLRINVNPPVFVRDAAPVIAPLTILPPTSFGFATTALLSASVVKVADGWRMYFDALHVQKMNGKDQTTVATGVATSADGKKFTPPGTPLFETPIDGVEAHGFTSAFVGPKGTQLFYARNPFYLDLAHSRAFGYLSIFRLLGDEAGAFALDPNASILPGSGGDSGCPFCTSLDTPSVIPDANPALSGGGPDATVMFFSALQPSVDENNNTTYTVVVVRAAAPNGQSYIVDPSPLLKSTADEAILYAPRVIVDGSIYKMFYSLASASAVDPAAILDPCSPLASYRVGYATSSDGYFWVRSPRNASHKTKAMPNPPPAVFDVNPLPGQWDSGKSVQVSSVLPQDGVDPSSGLVLYYTAYDRQLNGVCLPNGVGRAVRR